MAKLTVENFGKIKKAEIELSDLILFIGDNNSGKSYLMTLIYGFYKYNEEIVNILFNDEKFIKELEEYKQSENIINKYTEYHKEYLKEYLNENNEKIYEWKDDDAEVYKNCLLGKEELSVFNKLFNILLNKYKYEIIKFIFNDNEDFIKLDFISLDLDIYNYTLLISEESIFCESDYFTGSIIFHDYNKKIDNLINILIYIIKINIKINLKSNFNDTIFLPTSRTGFLLSYKEIIKQSMKLMFGINNNDNIKTFFQNPTIDFINSLIDLSNNYVEDKNQKDIIKLFEENIIHGKIETNKETNAIYYIPSDTDFKVPMHLTSAVITEIAPLYLLLKYENYINNIFIEEPEMSLHLKLQKQMARILINLVNSNKKLIISTHSDTILEHINNMIKLHNIEDIDKKNDLFEKYSYTEMDTINIDRVRIYQFDTDENNMTSIEELKPNDKSWFYIETFHRYINKASYEYDDISEF